ncbi:hypothetical protein G6F22_013655 [Rhizopus arrhizus]|nr:hypothetical protein G6F22_013655 [Rhizopus arrhizus]
MGDGQGHAGSEQDQRVDQRQAPGRDGLERTTDRRRTIGRPSSGIALPEQLVGHHPAAFAAQPRQAEVTGVEQRAEEGAEEHHFGEDEPDHAHPERAVDLAVVVAGLRFAHHVAEPPEQGQHQHRDADVERPASPAGIVEPAGHADHGHHHRDGAHERPFALGRDEVHVGVGRCLGHVGIRVRVRQGVGQGDRPDLRRQVRIDDETYRHVALLAGLQRLRGEAEALGLAEESRRACRCHRRHGTSHHGLRAVVAGKVQRFVELAGHHVHGQLLGMERPWQARIDAAIELDAHGTLAGHRARAGLAAGATLQAHAEHLLAGDAVQRHQRERQQEHRYRHAEQARQPGAA